MSNPIDNYNKIVTTVNSVTSDYTFEADANNLIVIDTSNNRIGINTVHPQRSIHISGGDVSSGIITPYLQMISGGEGVGSDFIPSQDNIYTLGSESKQWKDLYVGPGSIYMNKKRIFSLDSNNNLNLNISGDGLKLDSNLDISGYIHNTNDILNNVNISGNVVPTSDNKYSLGDNTKGWSDLYIKDGGIYLKNQKIIYFDENNILTISSNQIQTKNSLTVNGTFSSSQSVNTNNDIGGGNIYGTMIGKTANGALNICGGFFSTLDAAQNSTFQQDLIVENDISVNQKLKVGSDVSLNANVDISNHLTVLGDVSLNSNVDISNHLTVFGDVSLNDNVDISNHLTVFGDVSLNSNVDISNHLTVLGDVSLNDNVKIGNHLTVLGDVSLNDNVDISNHLTVLGDVSLNANVDISNHLTVLNGDVSFNNNVKIGNHLTVLGDVSLNDNVDISNHLTVLGDVSLNANVDISNHLTVLNGDVSFNNNVKIGNHLTVLGDVSFNNNVKIGNHLTVFGDVSLNSNVDISNHLTVLNGDVSFNNNVKIGNHLTVLGDVSLNSNVDISNHLTVFGDASLNNVDICGNLNINEGKLILNNNTILEKRITSGSIFRCANFYEDFNDTLRYGILVRSNGNNNYAMLTDGGGYKIYDRYTKKKFNFTSTTSSAEAQFDYWHQSITQYGVENSTTLVFDEFIFGESSKTTTNNSHVNQGDISIYRRDETNFDWTYKDDTYFVDTTIASNNDNNYVNTMLAGNNEGMGNKLHLSPDGSRLFWTSKTTKYIHMLYRGERNRSYGDVRNEYNTFFHTHVYNDRYWYSKNRITDSIESQFTDAWWTGDSNNEYVHYGFDSNTDGTILTALTTSNNSPNTSKIYILYSPTLKSSPEGIFNMLNGTTNNFSDISGDEYPGNFNEHRGEHNKGIHNDYFIFQTIVFNNSTDGIFNINYGYNSPETNTNIDSIGGPIGRIINTNTTVYLDVTGKISTELLLYSKQIMSNDGLTLVVNDSGYNNNNGCIIILERPTIDVSFTYSTFFQGGDFQTPPTGVRFGQALAITQSDQIYAGSVSTGIMGHNFIINKIGNQWVETLLELPRNSQSNQDSYGEGFGSHGGGVNMSSDGNSLVGGYTTYAAYASAEYYLKESNENFITSYGAIHNSIRADYIYNNFGAQLTSDDRYKIQEKIINDGLQTIRLLNPKKYLKTTLEYKADYSGNIQPNDSVFEESGLIAQELLDISNLNYVVSENDNKYNVRYNDIFIHGLAATKELDIIVQTQQNKINNLEAENTLIKNALNELLRDTGKPNV